MLKVILPDGSEKFYEKRVSPLDVASEIGAGLAKATVAAVVTTPDTLDENGAATTKTTSATDLLPEAGVVELRLLTKKDSEALDIMRHSCAHVMARAVMRLFKGVQLAFGPTTENGFYYDFWKETPFTDDDFVKIEAEMAKIVQEDEPFERIEMKRDDAIELLRAAGQTRRGLGPGKGEDQHFSLPDGRGGAYRPPDRHGGDEAVLLREREEPGEQGVPLSAGQRPTQQPLRGVVGVHGGPVPENQHRVPAQGKEPPEPGKLFFSFFHSHKHSPPMGFYDAIRLSGANAGPR